MTLFLLQVADFETARGEARAMEETEQDIKALLTARPNDPTYDYLLRDFEDELGQLQAEARNAETPLAELFYAQTTE